MLIRKEGNEQIMKRAARTVLIVITIVLCEITSLLGVIAYEMSAPTTSGSSVKALAASPTAKVKPSPEGSATASYDGFTTHVFIDTQGNLFHYYLYIPVHYNYTQKYPLVLLLHGGGERSSPSKTAEQNEQVLLNDPYAQVWSADYNAPGNPQIQQHWPCFVVIPQLGTGQDWVNVPINGGSYSQPAQPSTGLLVAKEILDALQQEYTSIDANRLYVTGLSLGGYGTWDAIERWPN
ncbi:MAG TPA: peptidase, partial [Ktedonobacteraceae bacterium]